MEQSVAEFNDDGAITVSLLNNLRDDPSTIVAATLYRFVREGLNNAAKHAHGARVVVTLRGAQRIGFGARVNDDGPGFTPLAEWQIALGSYGPQLDARTRGSAGRIGRVPTSTARGTSVEVLWPSRTEPDAVCRLHDGPVTIRAKANPSRAPVQSERQ